MWPHTPLRNISYREQKKQLITPLVHTRQVFEKLNQNNFVFWAVTKNPKFRVFLISLARKKIERLNFSCWILFANWTEDLNYVLQNWGTFKNLEKIINNQKLSFWIRPKSELFSSESALFQRKTALKQCCWVLVLGSKNLHF